MEFLRNQDFKEVLRSPEYGDTGILKLNIACHFLHFAKTEDIWLKSALEGEKGVLLTTGETVEKIPKQILG